MRIWKQFNIAFRDSYSGTFYRGDRTLYDMPYRAYETTPSPMQTRHFGDIEVVDSCPVFDRAQIN